MKVVINKCFGGFSLSQEAYEFLGLKWDGFGYILNKNIARNDPKLVEVVERLGDRANGIHAKLEIVEIPDGVEWEINEFGGQEEIHEKHRKWQ